MPGTLLGPEGSGDRLSWPDILVGAIPDEPSRIIVAGVDLDGRRTNLENCIVDASIYINLWSSY